MNIIAYLKTSYGTWIVILHRGDHIPRGEAEGIYETEVGDKFHNPWWSLGKYFFAVSKEAYQSLNTGQDVERA